MEKTYEWKTAKGAAVKMEVSSVSEKITTADGIEINSKPEIKITNLTVNETKYDASFGHMENAKRAMFKVGTQQAAVEIPESIIADIYAEKIAATNAATAAEAEYQQHVANVYRKMNP